MKGKEIWPRRPGSIALLVSLFILVSARAIDAITPNEWRFRQAIEVPASGLIRVNLPAETLDAARPNLEDVRLLDPAGRETPYIIDKTLDQPEGEFRVKDFQAQIEGAATRLRIETGTDATLRGVTLEAPGIGEFIKPARVEGSRDGTNWQLLGDHEPVFRLAGGTTKLRLPLPRSSWQFLRVTLDDSRSGPVPVTGAVLHTGAINGPAESMTLSIRSRDEALGVTRLALDLGAANLTPTVLHIETPEPLFARRVTVAVARMNGDKVAEQPLVSAIVYRMEVNGAPQARLDIPIDRQVDGRELILLVQNGDSPPLPVGTIRGERRTVQLTFPAHEPGRYLVLTGNNQCSGPNYDLAELAPDLKAAPSKKSQLFALAVNPDFRAADSLAAVSFAGVKLDVGAWGYRKSLHLLKSGIQEMELDPEILVHATPDFRDLRVMRDDRQIPFLLEKTSVSRSVPLSQTSSDDPARPTISQWSLKLPRTGLPITRIICTLGPGLFQRDLRLIETRGDERGENHTIDLGFLHVIQAPNQATRDIAFELSRSPASDTLILQTDNGDNSAIDLHNFRAEYSITRLIFKGSVDAGVPLWLYYGNKDASSPHYDVALVANELLHSERTSIAAGAEEILKPARLVGYTLTGASRYIFWGVLGLVVVGLLALVARFVPKRE